MTQAKIDSSDRRNIGAWRYLLLTGIFVLVAGAGILYIFSNRTPRILSVEGTRFIFMDGGGRKLMEYDSRIPRLVRVESETIQNGIVDDFGSQRSFPRVAIIDRKPPSNWEAVLFPATEDGALDDMIFCVSRRGRRCWEYRTELDVIVGYLSNDIDGDGRAETIVLSIKRDEHFSEIAILDERGNPKAKFFNPGILHDFICEDVAGDSRKEIIAVGEYRPKNLPALAVLDLDKLCATRPPPMDALPEALIRTAEYYILFPDDPIETKHFDRQALRRVLVRDGNGGKEILARNLKEFRFSLSAGLIDDIKPTGRYLLEFPAPNDGSEENDALRRHLSLLKNTGLLYFDGLEFIKKPTPIVN